MVLNVLTAWCGENHMLVNNSKNKIVHYSKKISNDQESIQSDPHPALNTKREITKCINWQQFTEGTRGKPNEQLFPKQVVIHSYLKFTKYVTNIIAEPKYKYGQQEQVTIRNHNRSTALERSVLKYWGT